MRAEVGFSLLEGERQARYLDSVHFRNFIRQLLPVDYALLIQRDPAVKTTSRYFLSHFHVRIDWPISEAAEDLGRSLRYISKELYERGEKYAEDMQRKFFEYYNQPFIAGGRARRPSSPRSTCGASRASTPSTSAAAPRAPSSASASAGSRRSCS